MVKSDSLVGSGIYSALGGWFGTGAYKYLQDDAVVERLEQLLSQEDPDMASRMRGLLCQKFPKLEKKVQPKEDYFLPEKPIMQEKRYNTPDLEKTIQQYPIQEIKKQIMQEKGYKT